MRICAAPGATVYETSVPSYKVQRGMRSSVRMFVVNKLRNPVILWEDSIENPEMLAILLSEGAACYLSATSSPQ